MNVNIPNPWLRFIVYGLLVVLGAIFFIIVVVPLVALMMLLALGILVGLTLGGLLWGFVIGGRNFWETVREAHVEAERHAAAQPLPKPRRFRRHPQPAFKMYFYEKAWFVLRYTYSHIWNPTRRDADSWSQWGRDLAARSAGQPQGWEYVPLRVWFLAGAGGAFVGGRLHFVAAFIIVVLFIVVQVIVSIVGRIATTIIVALLAAFNALRARYYRIYSRCPKANCHAEMEIPIYICPDCGVQHDRLWPSRYGILHHRCKGPDGQTCGRNLPTIDWLGRKDLDRICPTCQRFIVSSIGRGTNYHLPIVGGPSAGKSHFLVAATQQLMEVYGPRQKMTITLPDEDDQRDFTRSAGILQGHGRLDKTSDADANPTAFNLEISRRRKVPGLLYIYDAAGEHYGTGDRGVQQVYFRYVHGVVLIIDPFSIPKVRDAYQDQLDRAAGVMGQSSKHPDEVFEIMLRVLETHHSKHTGQIFELPVAVVITKSDAFDLEEKVGSPAAQRLMVQNGNIPAEADAIHLLVQEFLRDYGASNLMVNLHNRFANVQYFSCSSLGPDPDGYAPLRILDPLLWLMGQWGITAAQHERVKEVDRLHRLRARKWGGSRLGALRYYIWDSLKVGGE